MRKATLPSNTAWRDIALPRRAKHPTHTSNHYHGFHRGSETERTRAEREAGWSPGPDCVLLRDVSPPGIWQARATPWPDLWRLRLPPGRMVRSRSARLRIPIFWTAQEDISLTRRQHGNAYQ